MTDIEMPQEMMYQEAFIPQELFELVSKLSYKPGWVFNLVDLDRGQGSKGLTLVITTCTVNSYHHEITNYKVDHYMIVPAAGYDRRSWQRWLLEQLFLVERHEACEFFDIGGERPYAPSHGPGNDPYIVREIGTEEDQRTSFRGEVKTTCLYYMVTNHDCAICQEMVDRGAFPCHRCHVFHSTLIPCLNQNEVS